MTDSIKLFVPGRLCLFGEHSDWAGLNRAMNADIAPGRAIVTGIDQGIYAEVTTAHDITVRNASAVLADGWADFHSSMDANELREVAQSDSFFCCCYIKYL
jgi:galactokinase